MRELIKMVVVLTLISLASGGLLAALRDGTQERIEIQELEFVKGPTIRDIFKDAANDPIASRFQIKDGEKMRTFFVGVLGGEQRGVAFESFGRGGYGGDIGLMIAVDVNTDKIMGVGVTKHSETPGLGARARTDPKFSAQFKGRSVSEPAKVTQDGGSINAISGATVTSRAVCSGLSEGLALYQRLKPQLTEKIKAVK